MSKKSYNYPNWKWWCREKYHMKSTSTVWVLQEKQTNTIRDFKHFSWKMIITQMILVPWTQELLDINIMVQLLECLSKSLEKKDISFAKYIVMTLSSLNVTFFSKDGIIILIYWLVKNGEHTYFKALQFSVTIRKKKGAHQRGLWFECKEETAIKAMRFSAYLFALSCGDTWANLATTSSMLLLDKNKLLE